MRLTARSTLDITRDLTTRHISLQLCQVVQLEKVHEREFDISYLIESIRQLHYIQWKYVSQCVFFFKSYVSHIQILSHSCFPPGVFLFKNIYSKILYTFLIFLKYLITILEIQKYL